MSINYEIAVADLEIMEAGEATKHPRNMSCYRSQLLFTGLTSIGNSYNNTYYPITNFGPFAPNESGSESEHFFDVGRFSLIFFAFARLKQDLT